MDANRPRRSLSFGIDSILQEDERNGSHGRQLSSDHPQEQVDHAYAEEHVLPCGLNDAQLTNQSWSFIRINAHYSPPQPLFQVQYAGAPVTPPIRASASAKRLGHPYQSRAPARHKKPRTSFTKAQIAILEKRFASQKYLASSDRAAFAAQLEMSDSQVKTWFQNRRTKWRRQEAEEREYERRTAAKILPRSNALVGPLHF